MGQLKTLECEKCGGEMRKKHEAAHSQGASLLLIILGIILLFIFPIGTIFGVIILFVGLSRGSALRYVWVCRDCGYKFERAESRLDELIDLLGLEKLKFKMDQKGIITFILITLGIALLIVILLNVVSSKNNQKTSQTIIPVVQNNDMQIGDDGYLRLPGITDSAQVICLGTTKDDANKIGKVLVAKDFMGLLEIPGAFCVGSGSKIRLIDIDFPYRKVKIIQGVNKVDSDKIGLAGWLPFEWVVKN